MTDDKSWMDDPYDPRWDTEAHAQVYNLENLVKLGRESAGVEDLDPFSAVKAGKQAMADRGYDFTTEGPVAETMEELHPSMTFTFVRRP